jgi:hypothetical protein
LTHTMKVSRAMKLRIEYALRNAMRAHRYLQRTDVAICKRDTAATTTSHYSRQPDGACLIEVNRHIGSDLTGLQSCIASLEEIIREAI